MELAYKYETKILMEADLLIAREVKTKLYLKEDVNTSMVEATTTIILQTLQ